MLFLIGKKSFRKTGHLQLHLNIISCKQYFFQCWFLCCSDKETDLAKQLTAVGGEPFE